MTFVKSVAPHSVQTCPAFAPETAGTGSSSHPAPHTPSVPKSSGSANRKMNPNKTFSGKLLSNYTACCGTHYALPPASCHQHLCYCARGGWHRCRAFHEARHPFRRRFSTPHSLPFRLRSAHRKKTEERPRIQGPRRGGVSWHRACIPSSHCWTDRARG